LFALLFSSISFAQEEEYENEEDVIEILVPPKKMRQDELVSQKRPVQYSNIREEDKLWSTTLWRTIDCREKMNYHLYYPTEKMDYRNSLVQALVSAIDKKQIQAYDDEEFKIKLTPEEVAKRFDAEDKEVTQEKIDGSGDTIMIQKGYVNWGEVREFIVKEEWFFDKRHSRFDVRIEAICPIRVYKRTLNTGEEEVLSGEEVKMPMFWVWYPDARRPLAREICYTGKNNSNHYSFDDILHKRFFSSYITAESNSLNDRTIASYARNGMEAMMESERIKTELLKRESDLWEY